MEPSVYNFTTCDWEKFTNVPLIKNIKLVKTEKMSGKNKELTIVFGPWKIEANTTPSICCEKFEASWNKKELPKTLRFRQTEPTTFSIKYYHKLNKTKTVMKNTLSFCFDNGDTLSFTNIMNQRIYEHFIYLYHNDIQVFVTCI